MFFITAAKTGNVSVLNLITFKDYWHGGTGGKPSLSFVRCSQRDAGLSELEKQLHFPFPLTSIVGCVHRAAELTPD